VSDRTTFEAWAKTKEYWDFYTVDDVYQNLNTEAAWIVWQAAIASMPQPEPGELCPACAAAEFERVSGFGELK
jgi:hypothetical protein